MLSSAVRLSRKGRFCRSANLSSVAEDRPWRLVRNVHSHSCRYFDLAEQIWLFATVRVCFVTMGMKCGRAGGSMVERHVSSLRLHGFRSSTNSRSSLHNIPTPFGNECWGAVGTGPVTGVGVPWESIGQPLPTILLYGKPQARTSGFGGHSVERYSNLTGWSATIRESELGHDGLRD